MTIQWFPGHMATTKRAIAERMKAGIDVVIEMLDARLPGSSANPLLGDLTRAKPTLKILNKQDLADPACTAAWLAHYNALPGTRAIGLDASETAPAQRLIAASKELAPFRGGLVKPLRLMICGVPNVGKSTLINTLVGKRAAKTGDEPGITKQEQRIALASDVYLYDTPGMLWPKILVDQSGYNLAASGAVGRNALEEEVVAAELLGYVRRHYPGRIEARYKLGEPHGGKGAQADIAALNDAELLEAIGRRRGAVLPGGRINTQKAAEMVLNEFRSGALGRVSLETPEELAEWTAAALAAEAEREKERVPRRQRGRAAQFDDEAPEALDGGDDPGAA
ncbi:ribosome biogenesis GTPase YlqF [Sphaerotilus microaerophilus]|uniref:Ribosome biogenesis GTPase A n=1 Tax=Sphaerotilus microaerophilus TaxID=2914710 RepID=A0ABM7YKW9_9BURK|nr:ribosome biogenesis GTPase YlqF [Sphaerotilus sp. FB-5]BDI05028.1 ribosome biogenesis GTPase A [Sphaerotilus sp. FB-5]